MLIDKMKFSLLNFNTLGTPLLAPNIKLRYKKASEIINKAEPDIICFQEVVTYYHLSLLKKYLHYPYFFYKKFLFGPKGGLVIVSKIPFENIQYKNFASHGSLNNLSFYSKLSQHGILVGKLKNQPLLIANTHTVTDFEFDWSETNNLYQYVKLQMEQIPVELDLLTKRNQNSYILSGDFNLKKDSKLYKSFLKTTKATDVFSKFSFPTYYRDRLDYKFKGKTSERIDFVFVKQNKAKIQITSHGHLFNEPYTLANKKSSYLSDHIGLKAGFDMV